jgi:hypothetical protein
LGDCFLWAIFKLQNKPNFWSAFSAEKIYSQTWTRNGLGKILGRYIINSFGHPVLSCLQGGHMFSGQIAQWTPQIAQWTIQIAPNIAGPGVDVLITIFCDFQQIFDQKLAFS